MERALAMLLVLAMLLCGCSKTPQETDGTTEPTQQTQDTDPTRPTQGGDPDDGPDLGIYEPDSQIEVDTQGAVRKYPLEGTDYYALTTMADGVLLFSGSEDTTLIYLRDDTAPIRATLTDVFLLPMDSSCRVTDAGIGYYDAERNEMVFLDTALQEIRRTAMPEDMVCAPILSENWKYAYYFDSEYLRYVDLDTGICRLLADSQTPDQEIVDIHFGDSVLECIVYDAEGSRYLMVDAQTGETLYQDDVSPFMQTDGDWYFAEWFEGQTPQYLFGQREGELSCLTPLQTYPLAEPVPQLRSVVFYEYSDNGFTMEYYDTVDGTRKSSVTLEGLFYSDMEADTDRQMIWILADDMGDGTQALYGWDPELSPTGDSTNYITSYYTAEEPDTQGLERVAQEARQLGEKFGVRVLVYEDAVGNMPSDHTFEPEHAVPVYDYYLPVLEELLSDYPDGFLKKLGSSSGNGRLTVSLVRSIYGDSEFGALTEADGVQYWSGGNAYLALAMNDCFQGTFYHELFHCIDTYVLTETRAFDFWDSLNPEGFQYDNDYLKYQERQDDQYLTGDSRAFIDSYSMSFAKEDRARVMEYAMVADNEDCFASPIMQAKLRTICEGIREAFGLQREATAFLWEQYLAEPLGH